MQPNNDEMFLQGRWDFNRYVVTPDAREEFKHVTKDLELSKLTEEEVRYLNKLFNLIRLLRLHYKQYDEVFNAAQQMFLDEIYTYLALNRSIGGFEREVLAKFTTREELATSKNLDDEEGVLDSLKRGFLKK